jgi:hypothetical protein
MTDTDISHLSRLQFAGTASLLLGVVLLILNGIEEASGLSGMPRFWYHNRIFWWGLGIALTGAGTRLLGRLKREEEFGSLDRWRPSLSGIRFKSVLLYTRVGCHLCDDAREILERHQRWLPRIVEADIDTDPRLVERYGTCVPVVVLDGKVRFRGRVPVELLRRLIEGTPAVE